MSRPETEPNSIETPLTTTNLAFYSSQQKQQNMGSDRVAGTATTESPLPDEVEDIDFGDGVNEKSKAGMPMGLPMDDELDSHTQQSPAKPATVMERVLSPSKEFSIAHRGPINSNSLQAKTEKSIVDEGVDGLHSPTTDPEYRQSLGTRASSLLTTSISRSRPNSVLGSRRDSIVKSRPNSAASNYPTGAALLPALQSKALDDLDGLEPLAEEDVEPGSFDLTVPVPEHKAPKNSLQTLSEKLFSKEHLTVIFSDPAFTMTFTNFLCTQRPQSVPLLIYYFDALKALKAIDYSNAVQEALKPLEDHNFTNIMFQATANDVLKEKAAMAFEVLVQEELPRFITHVWIQTVSTSIKKRITGTMPAHLMAMSEGLAEVFCLTDPSRDDNPIIFASEEFHRTTQYGMDHAIGRNCRFLQGPKTNPFSVKRIRDQLAAGKEHYETFLNYRRDGSPFMNLFMCAPLLDSSGKIRYYIGAQVDVSGLAKDCIGLPSFQQLLDDERDAADETGAQNQDQDQEIEDGVPEKDEFRELSKMFNLQELDTVRKHGGSMRRAQTEELGRTQPTANWNKPRIVIQDESSGGESGGPTGHTYAGSPASGRLSGIYENYVLVRPYPNLNILFASPSLRTPGILQSPFLTKIGGSSRVRDEIIQAFADGTSITAKIRWVANTRAYDPPEGRARWIHCTPLIGSNGAVGVWMVVIVNDGQDYDICPPKRVAPPIESRLPRQYVRQRRSMGGCLDDVMELTSFAATDPAEVAGAGGRVRPRSELAPRTASPAGTRVSDLTPSEPLTLRSDD